MARRWNSVLGSLGVPGIAVFSVVLLSASAFAAPTATRTVWGPPFSSSHVFLSPLNASVTGCTTGISGGPFTDGGTPSAGAFSLNISDEATRYRAGCGGSGLSSFGFEMQAGVGNLSFTVPAAGVYNISALWSGKLQGLVELHESRSHRLPNTLAGFTVWEFVDVSYVRNQTAVGNWSWVIPHSGFPYLPGVYHPVVRLDRSGPIRVTLQPSTRYSIRVGLQVNVGGDAGGRTSPKSVYAYVWLRSVTPLRLLSVRVN